MKILSTEHDWNLWKALQKTVLLFAIVSAVSSSRGAPVVDTVTELIPSDATTNLQFGISVGIDNGVAAVGAVDSEHGAVYTYALAGSNWVQTQKILDFAPPSLPDLFGTSLAIEGDLLVVGQPQGFPEPLLSGQALVYRRVGGTWFFETKFLELNPPSPVSGFGTSVALSDGTIAVGNPNDPTGPGSGAVSIFVVNGTNWSLQAKVTAPAGTFQAFFGAAVALSGDTLLVGAPQIGVSGGAFIFVRNGTNWTLQRALTSPVPHTAEDFGLAVALQGDTAVVGAPGLTTPLPGGAAFVFQRFAGNWAFEQELQATDNTSRLEFGASLSILNGILVVGVPLRTVNGLSGAGGVDLFTFDGTSWVLAQQLVAPDASSEAEFGRAVDIGASGIIVGAPLQSSIAPNAGEAYIFSESQTNGPVIVSASASPSRLFPPNHKLVPVTISVNAQNAVSCKIVSVSSNQPINGKGDGNTSPDWVITGDLTVLLRAERAGNIKTDRVYTISVQCTDTFGNTASTTVQVTVPHDNGK